MSLEDPSKLCTALERKLRGLKRNILGIKKEGEGALSDPTKIPIFKAKLAVAQSDWTRFQNTWDERDSVQVQMSDPNAWPDDQWNGDYDKVRDEICQAAAILVRIEQKSAETQIRHTATITANDGNTTLIQSAPDAHLPKINIPTFTGDLLHWSHFKDTFVSMVQEEPTLTNIMKFHYLRSSLKGEAATLLSRIPIGDQSYIQAWDKLMKTYDNPRVLASLYIQRILDCDAKSQKTDLLRYESFLNGVADGIEGFQSLNIDDKADFLLSALAIRALDQNTRNQLELSIKSSDKAPTANQVIEFVRTRMNALKLSRDTLTSNTSNSFSAPSNSPSFNGRRYPNRQAARYNTINLHTTDYNYQKVKSASKSSKPQNKLNNKRFLESKNAQSGVSNTCRPTVSVCPFCKNSHALPYCHEFCNLPLERRIAFVQGWSGCRNCLRVDHKVATCTSKWSCRFCRQRHHSIIHAGNQPKAEQSAQPQSLEAVSTFIGFGSAPSACTPDRNIVCLGTVQLLIKDHRNAFHSARAVLDSGSMHTFISASLANKLGFKFQRCETRITGLGGSVLAKPLGSITCNLRPYQSLEEVQCQALIVGQVSPFIPHVKFEDSVYENLSGIDLADRAFDTPGSIDLLIRADLYPSLVTGAPYESVVPGLFLLPTIFGSAVMGKVSCPGTQDSIVLFSETDRDIEAQLKAFWELEEPIAADRRHPDDQYCEDHFQKTTSRTPDGRYMVRFPIKPGSRLPGDNREVASRRFFSLERKLFTKHGQASNMAESYRHFMKEYEDLEHMSLAHSPSSYLIPHHGVWKDGKIRVVFDASCSSVNGTSLNDILLSGPKLQRDICQVLTQFRSYAIPLKADLVKMYRQILIHPEDRHLQHVLWREKPDGPLLEYELNTVTYGVKSSAFHALRVIIQLVTDEGSHFPLAAERVQKDMFVDDIATGADSLPEATALKEELCGLFEKGGFSISKWASTEKCLIPDSDQRNDEPITIKQEHSPSCESVKILGLIWIPKIDAFSYRISSPVQFDVTKRIILSSIAKIFDPLGFLSPVIFLAKVLMQDVWKAQTGWDDRLPSHLADTWHSLVCEWPFLPTISIPRYFTTVGATHQAIGFCDASTRGYAAAVYLRSISPSGEVKISLIKAKTKVAPLKFVSIARLELCGALLLSRLLASIEISGMVLSDSICFTDSSNVLAWLELPIHQLRVFEANRVSQILSITPLHCWRHVASEHNPCDIASRGCTPSKIKDHKLWWNGPSWLLRPESEWPRPRPSAPIYNTLMTQSSSSSPKGHGDDWMTRFSSVRTLIRTVARMLRFKEVCKSLKDSLSRPVTAEEYRNAKMRVIRCVQLAHFPSEIYRDDAKVPKAYQQLAPFVDPDGIIRVGGRLQNSPLGYNAKHPVLIPPESYLARIIIDDIHQTHYHAGPTLVLSLLRGEFRIPRALQIIRGHILRCVRCRLQRAQPKPPFMAPLPRSRFSQLKAFANVGVDYAGPFLIKESKRRKAAPAKAYLCIFVCLATKAVHLEAVSSLTTAAFLAAFERFVSRRGLPNIMSSDNGTNFVGASRFIKDVYAFMAREQRAITQKLASHGVEWRFIPPRAPHFGGIWEAGVRSVKTLLSTTIGSQSYTFEELTTAFVRIEGLLNSRPLCALNEDIENYDFLTPGHFLVGSSLHSLPEPSDLDKKSMRSRWCALQAQVASIWNRWTRDYLHSLQQRRKWTTNVRSIKVGELMILLEKKSIVGQWPVARVIVCHPGRDGITRAVTLRTPSGSTLKRAVTSLAPLFHDEPNDF